MKKKLLILTALFGVFLSYAQECPALISPSDGAVGVSVSATISWEAVEGVSGYIISLGTSEGGTDILNAEAVGSATSYTPPTGLPENTQVYVTITLFLLNLPDITCESQSFTTEQVTEVPLCTQINTPADGATDVNPATSILWNHSQTATGYIISIGTAPNLTDVVNNLDVGESLSYNPPTDFDPETTYYVTITPYNNVGSAGTCTSSSFTTSEVAPLPNCTQMVNPANGATNVPLTPLLEWEEVPNATAYYVTIGTSPTNTDILDNAIFYTNSTYVIDFEPNKVFFIRIVPFNDSGAAIGCIQETFSTILGCGPFFDATTGDLITYFPELEFQDVFSFCENESSLTIAAPEGADGYRWFYVDVFGNDSFIAEGDAVQVQESGNYYLEAYNLIPQPDSDLECPQILPFEVVLSEAPMIENINVQETALGLNLTVSTVSNGNYEYAIDSIDGPYQESNFFSNVPPGTHTLYVRDKGGCGIAQETIEYDITVEGFPKFFTPNGDSINDFWQYITPPGAENIVFTQILIFDRYGKLMKQINQDSVGWDGTYLGRPVPSGEYWFQAVDSNEKVFNGHFSIKR